MACIFKRTTHSCMGLPGRGHRDYHLAAEPGKSLTDRGAPARSTAGVFLLAGVLASAALAAMPGAAAAQVNGTTPGTLTAYTTVLSAGFEWFITGDDNGNCSVTLEYRKLGDVTWKPAQPLLRVEHGLWTHGEDPGNLLAGSLFFLQPGTSYEARLTLSDPDGGADQRIVGFTTRTEPRISPTRILYVVPGAGGGSGSQTDPLRGLAAADAIAQPGDLFLVQPGTYHGRLTVKHDGTVDHPIVYLGVSQSGVILDGDGGTTSVSNCVGLISRRYVTIQNMSLVNCLRPVDADSSVGITIKQCLIQPVNQPLEVQGIRAAISRDLFISDNTVLMTGQWATIGRTGAYGTGGYGILIEGTGHVVCHNTIVEAWDGISIPVTGTAVPACITSNVDIYENYIDRASDDGIQADATHHNVRIFRNRLLNSGSGVSFQPAFGGPGYVLYNEMYNNRIEPYKFHQETYYGWTQETSGFVVFHNTTFCNRNAWYESGIWRHGKFRNNLMLGGRTNTPSLLMDYIEVGADFDGDALNRVAAYPTLVRYISVSYADMPAFNRGTGHEPHGLELTPAALINAPTPHNPEWNYTDGYGAAYTPADIDLRLAPGSAALDRGVPLANINDGFLGSAPDLGCYEFGVALPLYGPRPPDPTTSALELPAAPLALDAEPNPFATATTIRFELPQRDAIALRVYDVRGALVRTLADQEFAAGPHALAWDGRSAGGAPAAPGVYFVRLSRPGAEATRRIALVR